jgi:hypothetical protein
VGPGERVDLSRRLDERAAAVRIMVGPHFAADRDWFGPAAVRGALELAPHDPGGARGFAGVEARVGGNGYPTGSFTASAGALVPTGPLDLGARVSAGVVWRRPSGDRPEGAPLLVPTLYARTDGPTFMSLDVAPQLFIGEGRPVAVFAVAASVGARVSPPRSP